jgi:hypothetical protein
VCYAFSRRPAVCLAAVAVSLATLVPVASAATAPAAPGGMHPRDAIPSDCTLTNNNVPEWFLKCTARPATQKWEIGADCVLKYGVYYFRAGNVVTGDGTSSMEDCPGSIDMGFYPVS